MLLERPRSKCKDNNKMDVLEIGGCRGHLIEKVQDRDRWRALVGKFRGFCYSKKKYVDFLDEMQTLIFRFPRKSLLHSVRIYSNNLNDHY
jgi:hypothetical protein